MPEDINLSFFVGKSLIQVSFAANVIHLGFDDNVHIGLQSSFQHQKKIDVENQQLGTMQSVYLIQTSSLMQLLEHSVVAVVGEKNGTLSLTFDNGDIFHCFEDTKAYECYNFSDGNHVWVV